MAAPPSGADGAPLPPATAREPESRTDPADTAPPDTAGHEADPSITAQAAPATTAADRLQTRPSPPPRPASPRRSPVRRWIVLAALGALGASAAVVWMGRTTEDADLLSRLVDASDAFRPELTTTDEDAAAGFVMDAFGWPVAAPRLDGLQLVGVGEAVVLSTPELEVGLPAFDYSGAEGESAVVFVYDYVLLDETDGALALPDPMYARLAEDPPVDVRRQGGHSIVTWRDRAVIYAAVTEDEPTSERIARSVP